MANFYAQLKQSITDFDVLYTELPSYIKHFVPARNDGEKVILFCSKVRGPNRKSFLLYNIFDHPNY